MRKLIILLIVIIFIALAGCTEPQPSQGCAQVITPAVSPDGTCTDFPTPCDVPVGYTIVDTCGESEPAPEPTPEPGPAPEPEPTPEPNPIPNLDDLIPKKFDFDADLKYCEYDGLVKKYNFFYQIRNRTDNMPTYLAKIWLKIPELDKADGKTIQGNYEKNRILWEEQRVNHVTYGGLRGQYWDIRNIDTNVSADYQLIYCEPEVSDKSDCTPESGIVITQGNTGTDCRIAGQID